MSVCDRININGHWHKLNYILKKKLINKVHLITPNIPEAEILTDLKISNQEEMKLAAKRLIDMGAKHVLLKGGHLKSKEVFDFLQTSVEAACNTLNTIHL